MGYSGIPITIWAIVIILAIICIKIETQDRLFKHNPNRTLSLEEKIVIAIKIVGCSFTGYIVLMFPYFPFKVSTTVLDVSEATYSIIIIISKLIVFFIFSRFTEEVVNSLSFSLNKYITHITFLRFIMYFLLGMGLLYYTYSFVPDKDTRILNVVFTIYLFIKATVKIERKRKISNGSGPIEEGM